MNRTRGRGSNVMREEQSINESTLDAGFAQVGQRMVRWTNNLIGSALVLVVGGTMGWGTLRMWNDAEGLNGSTIGIASGKAAQTLQGETQTSGAEGTETNWQQVSFGGQRFDRCVMYGDQQQAVSVLQARCERIARSPSDKSLRVGSMTEADANGAESGPFNSSKHTFISESSNEIHSIRCDGLMPIVITLDAAQRALDHFNTEQRSRQPNASSHSGRVLSWGLVMPAGGRNVVRGKSKRSADDESIPHSVSSIWTLFAFHPLTNATHDESLPMGITLPFGSQISMMFTDHAARRLIGFTSASSLIECERDFDLILNRRDSENVTSASSWNRRGKGSFVSWTSPTQQCLTIHLDERTDALNSPYVIGLLVCEER